MHAFGEKVLKMSACDPLFFIQQNVRTTSLKMKKTALLCGSVLLLRKLKPIFHQAFLGRVGGR